MAVSRVRDVRPVTVVADRYGGTYSRRGCWLAFPCDPQEVPKEPFDDDLVAQDFWEAATLPIGGGASPDNAYENLVGQLVTQRPTQVYGPNPGHGGYMWTWEVLWPDGHTSLVDSMLETAPWTGPDEPPTATNT